LFLITWGLGSFVLRFTSEAGEDNFKKTCATIDVWTWTMLFGNEIPREYISPMVSKHVSEHDYSIRMVSRHRQSYQDMRNSREYMFLELSRHALWT
jgi:hypothetical protein